MVIWQLLRGAIAAIFITTLVACGDGGSDSRNFNTLGGAVVLQLANAPQGAVTGLQLSDGTETYAVTLPAGQTSGKVNFTFPTALSQGTHYAVLVASNPAGIGCAASNNSGTMGSVPVSSVTITCTDTVFTVSGTVNLNSVNALSADVPLVISDGNESTTLTLPDQSTALTLPFQFQTPVATGATYKVTVPANPPNLACTTANGTGTVTDSNITDVVVTCSDSAFQLSGHISLSLQSTYPTSSVSVLLTDQSGDFATADLSIPSGTLTALSSFAFKNLVATGTSYTVSISTDPQGNPTGLACTPTSGANSGVITSANVSNIDFACTDQLYAIGGTVSGLTQGILILSNGANSCTITPTTNSCMGGVSGFTLTTAVAYNAPYDVQVAAQSLSQCTVTNGSGSVGPHAVTDVSVDCVSPPLARLAGYPGGPGYANAPGGPASSAQFRNPEGVAVDASGNLYIADTGNNVIRKITPAGAVTTFAGSGVSGSANGVGSAAQFNGPNGITIDGAGNIYVTDTFNFIIRRITPAGVVTTLAGSGTNGTADGTGTAAQFNYPTGITTDAAGNIYVTDATAIRKIAPAGVVTTLAGSTTFGFADGIGNAAQFSQPTGIAADGAGNLYVADTSNYLIRKITPAGVVTTLAGSVGTPGFTDGTGTAAQFTSPTGVAVDGSGNIYVADDGNELIRKITPAGVVTTIAGTADTIGFADGTGTAAQFLSPYGITTDSSGDVYVADNIAGLIRKITPAAVVTTIAGSATNGSVNGTGSAAKFNAPYGIASDSAGNIFVADGGNSLIREITPAGVVTTFAGSGTAGYADGIGSAAQFNGAEGIAVDGAGNIYVADSGNNLIRKITPAGVVTTLAGSTAAGSADGTGSSARFSFPFSIATDGTGNIYVTDTNNATVRRITPTGVVTTLAGTAGTMGSVDGTGPAAQFESPFGIAIDSVGNIYVSDEVAMVIRKITQAGVVTTFAGTAGNPGYADGAGTAAKFDQPRGLAIDAQDNIYVADGANNLVRKITPAGVVTTVIGTVGAGGFIGAGGFTPGNLPGTLNSPNGLAIYYTSDTTWNLMITQSRGTNNVAEVVNAEAALFPSGP